MAMLVKIDVKTNNSGDFVLIPGEFRMRQYKLTYIVVIKTCHQPTVYTITAQSLQFDNFYYTGHIE